MFFIDNADLEFDGVLHLVFYFGVILMLLVPTASIISYLLRRKRFSGNVDEIDASTHVVVDRFFSCVFYRYQGKYWRSEIESKYLQDGEATLLVNPMAPNRVIAKPSIAKGTAIQASIVLTLLLAVSMLLLNAIYDATQKQGFQTWVVNTKEVIRTLEVWIYTGSQSEFMLNLGGDSFSVFMGLFALLIVLPILLFKMVPAIKRAFDGSRGQLAQQATTQEFQEISNLAEAA